MVKGAANLLVAAALSIFQADLEASPIFYFLCDKQKIARFLVGILISNRYANLDGQLRSHAPSFVVHHLHVRCKRSLSNMVVSIVFVY